jgi:hypothetical protein
VSALATCLTINSATSSPKKTNRMKQKQKQIIHECRDPQGPEWVILVNSPHWPPGVVCQFIIREWWYHHDDCIARFKEDCARDGCTVLVSQPAPKREDGRARYLTNAEVSQALKARRLLTPERAKYLEASK